MVTLICHDVHVFMMSQNSVRILAGKSDKS